MLILAFAVMSIMYCRFNRDRLILVFLWQLTVVIAVKSTKVFIFIFFADNGDIKIYERLPATCVLKMCSVSTRVGIKLIKLQKKSILLTLFYIDKSVQHVGPIIDVL